MSRTWKRFLGTLTVALFVLAGAGASKAHAGSVQFALFGGMDDGLETGGGLGYDVGVGLMFRLAPMFHFEVDGMYLSRAFTGFSNINYIEIPALLRFHLIPLLDVGVGGFYDIAVTSGAPKDYGLTFAVKVKPPTFPVFIEGRFNLGLDSTDYSPATSEIIANIGLEF